MIRNRKTDYGSYAFLLPAFIVYFSVIVIPVFYSFYVSLFKWNGIAEMEYVGLKNYRNLILSDPVFLTSVKNNMIWIFLTLIFTVSISLGLAVMLNNNFRGRTFFRGLFYFPCVLAPIAVSIIWRWMYNPVIGFVNEFARALGSEWTQTWLSNPKTALYAIFVASLWQGIGQPMILFLAGLQTVPEEVLEAAIIDGAGKVRRFFLVTVPLMRETFIVVIATLIIASMKVFDIVYGLTGGGPNNSTQMLSTYMYIQTFMYNNVGTGATISCIMVIIMLIVIIPYISFTAKED